MNYVGQKDFDHASLGRVGILLANLGTPDAPTAQALRQYLRQFLSDPRVIELPKWKWQIILNLSVLRTRPKQSAKLYREIWTEQGSPLLVTTKKQAEKLQVELSKRLDMDILVEVGMRYGNPSIPKALKSLQAQGVRKLLVLPLYPQYSGTTSASTFDEVADVFRTWRLIPDFRMIMSFHDDPGYIQALAKSVREAWERDGRGKKLLMSFHGIPERYVLNGDPYNYHCQETARLLAETLGLEEDEYLVSFQSRFGKEEWLKPPTDETLKAWGAAGLQSVDVMCPGFPIDCLETLEEINQLNRKFFLEAGGREYRYIPCLNDRQDFMDTLADIAQKNLHGWFDKSSADQGNTDLRVFNER